MKLIFDYKFRFYTSKMNDICLHCHWLFFSSIILNFEQCHHQLKSMQNIVFKNEALHAYKIQGNIQGNIHSIMLDTGLQSCICILDKFDSICSIYKNVKIQLQTGFGPRYALLEIRMEEGKGRRFPI